MVLMINPYSGSSGINEATILPPVGLVYIATYLREKGFDARVYDANIKGSNPAVVADMVRDTDPDIVGIYLNSFMINWTREFIATLREMGVTSVIGLGGPLPSVYPGKVLEHIGGDFVVTGEGEIPLEVMCRNIREGKPYYSDVPGIRYLSGSEVISGPPNERIRDLDILPFPDYSLLGKLSDYKVRAIRSPTAPIVTSRGCPFQCTFCSKAVFQSRTTFRSPQNVVEEIRLLKSRFGANQIDILDDNFTLKRSYAEEVIDGIIDADIDIAINLQSGVRVETLDEALIEKMSRAGVVKIGFGIESADKHVLEMCKKSLDLDKLREAVRMSKKYGIKVSGYFIIGLPGETRNSVLETVRFAKELKLDAANFAMAIPFPGTELYAFVREHGRFLIDPEANYDYGFFASEPFFELEGMDGEEMRYRFDLAYRSFYTPGKVLHDIVRMRSRSEFAWYLQAGWSLFRGKIKTMLSR